MYFNYILLFTHDPFDRNRICGVREQSGNTGTAANAAWVNMRAALRLRHDYSIECIRTYFVINDIIGCEMMFVQRQ